MRTLSIAFLAGLMVMALLLGNCFSCPQVLLAMQSHQSGHGCCHHGHKASPACQTQALQQFVKGGANHPPAPLLASIATVAPEVPDAAEPAAIPAPYAPYHPHDWFALRSIFRV